MGSTLGSYGSQIQSLLGGLQQGGTQNPGATTARTGYGSGGGVQTGRMDRPVSATPRSGSGLYATSPAIAAQGGATATNPYKAPAPSGIYGGPSGYASGGSPIGAAGTGYKGGYDASSGGTYDPGSMQPSSPGTGWTGDPFPQPYGPGGSQSSTPWGDPYKAAATNNPNPQPVTTGQPYQPTVDNTSQTAISQAVQPSSGATPSASSGGGYASLYGGNTYGNTPAIGGGGAGTSAIRNAISNKNMPGPGGY